MWKEAESELPEQFDYLGTRRHDFVVSSERIRLELGFREVTTRAARLTGLVDWLRDGRGP